MTLNILAHVKWFTPEVIVNEAPGIKLSESLLVIAAVCISLVAFHYIDILFKEKGITKTIDELFAPLKDWVPTVVRLCAAILILFNTFTGTLLSPNLENKGSLEESFLAATFTIAATLLLLGLLTRFGAGLMIAAYALSFIFIDFVEPLDHLEYLGMGLYTLFVGAGKLSLDNIFFRKKSEWSNHQELALPSLRIFTGLGLVVLAFSEKLLNISLAESFLARYDWNFLSGLGVDDRTFILLAGTVELVVGLSFVFNMATRVTSFALLILMTVTAIVLGPKEIAGHIFAVAVVLALWVRDERVKKPN